MKNPHKKGETPHTKTTNTQPEKKTNNNQTPKGQKTLETAG
jgi:hypothetical protein